jgi:hypothetical protein
MPCGRICTATSDGEVHIHTERGARVQRHMAHLGGATALCALSAGGSDADFFLSGGKDCVANIWRLEGDTLSHLIRYAMRANTCR